ncbi:MAG: hypothetical protein M4579_002325 [Chaenotheca gracillima]|nr:MAG: hypothetical protein M4579_002325 [Chaenotheca gracillima]
MMMPNGNLFSQPFDEGSDRGASSVVVLPLNLLAHIVSYLTDPRDLARICQTCRVLYYMTLPQLYQNITLESRTDVRVVDGVPEGAGGASPFTMALNGLVTRNVAGLVKSLRLRGQFKTHDLKQSASIGHLPDNVMLLNIVLRAAVDRMDKLQAFTWELDSTIHETVYNGMALRPSLRSLTLKCPSSRVTRPVTVIPPMPSLRHFKYTHIDPLCYPDDISLLLFRSRNLDDLQLHWSDRMRAEREPSVNLNTYFGKCVAAKYPLRLTSVSFQNLYCFPEDGYDTLFDATTLKKVTFMNILAGPGEEGMGYYDRKWRISYTKPGSCLNKIKFLRIDRSSPGFAGFLRSVEALEELYLVNDSHLRAALNSTKSTPSSMRSSESSYSNGSSPSNTSLPKVGRDNLDLITQNHGQTLKYLLLSDEWKLGQVQLGQLVRSCPNLEQLGMAIERNNYQLLSILLPFLDKLCAVRLLDDDTSLSYEEMRDSADEETRHACSLPGRAPKNLRYIGIGEKVYELCEEPVDWQSQEEMGEDPTFPQLRLVPSERVSDFPIWAMDKPDI